MAKKKKKAVKKTAKKKVAKKKSVAKKRSAARETTKKKKAAGKKAAPKKKAVPKKKAASKKTAAKKKAASKPKAKAKKPKAPAKKASAPKRAVAKPAAKGRVKGPHHVILGGGPAGINAVETIRSIDNGASRITLICDEPAYSRMVLPYYLTGKIPQKQVLTGDPEYFAKLGVDTLFGRRAVYVDTKASAVVLHDGQRVEYDDLLIATGSSPVRPIFDGWDLPGVETLWTLDDTDRVLKRLNPESRVVLVGAGFIGFIVLNALAKRGCGLDVVELERHVLQRMLDEKGAELVEGHLRSQQIGVYTGSTVQSVSRADDGRLTAELTTGVQLQADVVILATGIRPNIGFLEGSGIKTRRAVLVDDRLRTNVRNVYAAGDCAEGPDLLNGERTVHAIQPTAVDHGRVVGANMAGRRVPYRGSLLMNILDVAGIQCSSFGRWDADNLEVQTIANASRCSYRKLVWEEDRIVGAILTGPSGDVSNLNDMGMIKGIIQTQTAMGHWKQYLREHPLDIRRPYLATGVAHALLNTTLLRGDSADRAYRFKNAQPASKQSPHHSTFMRDFVPAKPGPSGPPR